MANITTSASTNGTITHAWPTWYGGTGATAYWPANGQGAWVNTTCATWNADATSPATVLRVSWVNGYLCLPTSSAATTFTLVPEQMAQIALSPKQHEELDRTLAARIRQAERRRRRQQREQQRAAREWEHAVRKADRLLIRHLSRSQRAMYHAEHRFLVVSPDRQRTYEITHGHAHNLFELDRDGRRVREMCVGPRDHKVPVPDIMLAQKLWIENMEAEMLIRANIWEILVENGERRLVRRGIGPQVQAA